MMRILFGALLGFLVAYPTLAALLGLPRGPGQRGAHVGLVHNQAPVPGDVVHDRLRLRVRAEG
jgi:hypothetical protein